MGANGSSFWCTASAPREVAISGHKAWLKVGFLASENEFHVGEYWINTGVHQTETNWGDTIRHPKVKAPGQGK